MQDAQGRVFQVVPVQVVAKPDLDRALVPESRGLTGTPVYPGPGPETIRRGRWASILAILALGLVASILVAVTVGSVGVPVGTVARIIFYHLPGIGPALVEPAWSENIAAIIWNVRVPRVVLAGLVGAALGTAGAAFQGLFRNPLADPYTVGVSSGATVGAALVMVLGAGWAFLGSALLPLAAFAGGLFTILLVYWLARIGGRVQVETLILAGVVMSAFMSAIFSFLLTMAGDTLHQIMNWLMGSLALRGWRHAGMMFPYLAAGLSIIWAYSRDLNLLALGEESAMQLGIDVERSKRVLLFAGALTTAAAVSVSGTIAFVGLIVPHLVRMLIGPDHRVLIPAAALAGAIFLVWADTLARVLLSPVELPVGVVTAVLGGPFFAYLLRTRRRSMGI